MLLEDFVLESITTQEQREECSISIFLNFFLAQTPEDHCGKQKG